MDDGVEDAGASASKPKRVLAARNSQFIWEP